MCVCWGGGYKYSPVPWYAGAVLKPYFASVLADIWGVLKNMNYVLRNKLLIPLESLQKHVSPDPDTI